MEKKITITIAFDDYDQLERVRSQLKLYYEHLNQQDRSKFDSDDSAMFDFCKTFIV